MRSRWLAWRALLAALLMVGFYVLAAAMIGALLFIPYAEVAYAHELHLKLALCCLLGAGAIAWAILPRFDRFDAPGPRLNEEEHPRLFERLRDVAARTNQTMPNDVYLVANVNAWVASRGGLMGFGSRRVMGLGLPLMQLADVEQFEAILAHEFGHYHGGDTRLGPWVHRTRTAIGRTLANLGTDGWLHLPFRWYGRLFLRITQAISRAQELSADHLAATVVGAVPLAEGLKRVHAQAPAFDAYWRQEAAPVLQAGYHVPLADGFARFLRVPRVVAAVDRTLAAQLESETHDPFDSHPPLRERLAALAPLVAEQAAVRTSGESAVGLLGDVQQAERSLLGFLNRAGDTATLQPLAWDEATDTVFVPSWRGQAARLSGALGAAVVSDLPTLVRARGVELARAIVEDGATISAEKVGQILPGPLGCCLAIALIDAGWKPSAAVGEPVSVRRGDQAIEPFAVVPALLADETAGDRWRATVRELGIGDIPLAAAVGEVAAR